MGWGGVLIAGLTAGCAGNGDGLNQNGEPIGSASGGSSSGSSTVTADFQSISDNVFTPICSKCHIGASAPEGLQLDAAHAYNMLVGVPSVEEPNLLRVNPGNPDESYMVLKIEGAPGIDGAQMPFGETPLPQATIAAIRQWITNGAANDSSSSTSASLAQAISAAASRAFAVESTTPADQTVVSIPPRQIVVAFTRQVDASLVNGTTVMLERVAPEATLAVPVSVALAEHNQAVLLVTPATALESGTYRLTLRGTGAAALADVDASVLGFDAASVFTVGAAQ
jgi:methionine-rich copper-binding protein CopC